MRAVRARDAHVCGQTVARRRWIRYSHARSDPHHAAVPGRTRPGTAGGVAAVAAAVFPAGGAGRALGVRLTLVLRLRHTGVLGGGVGDQPNEHPAGRRTHLVRPARRLAAGLALVALRTVARRRVRAWVGARRRRQHPAHLVVGTFSGAGHRSAAVAARVPLALGAGRTAALARARVAHAHGPFHGRQLGETRAQPAPQSGAAGRVAARRQGRRRGRGVVNATVRWFAMAGRRLQTLHGGTRWVICFASLTCGTLGTGFLIAAVAPWVLTAGGSRRTMGVRETLVRDTDALLQLSCQWCGPSLSQVPEPAALPEGARRLTARSVLRAHAVLGAGSSNAHGGRTALPGGEADFGRQEARIVRMSGRHLSRTDGRQRGQQQQQAAWRPHGAAPGVL